MRVLNVVPLCLMAKRGAFFLAQVHVYSLVYSIPIHLSRLLFDIVDVVSVSIQPTTTTTTTVGLFKQKEGTEKYKEKEEIKRPTMLMVNLRHSIEHVCRLDCRFSLSSSSVVVFSILFFLIFLFFFNRKRKRNKIKQRLIGV